MKTPILRKCPCGEAVRVKSSGGLYQAQYRVNGRWHGTGTWTTSASYERERAVRMFENHECAAA